MCGSGRPRSSSGTRKRAPVGRDGDVAVQGEVETTGDAGAVDLRHPQLAAALDVAEREVVGAVPLGGEALGILALPGEVATDAEPLAGAGEAHGVELGLAVGPDGGALEAAVHVLGERVALLDPVDADVQHAVGDVRDQVPAAEIGSVAHACPLSALRAGPLRPRSVARRDTRLAATPLTGGGRPTPRCRAAPC